VYDDTDKEILGYAPEYRQIAATLGPAARVCEIGVLRGGSLRMWQDLFPRGIVAGVDIDPLANWPPGTARILAAQDDPALPAMLTVFAPAWDLIVDDASHQGYLTKAAFGLLWPLVAPGGFYVIEDWFIGLPSWNDCLAAEGFSAPPYDPELLHLVQGLLTRLDKPFPAWDKSAALPWGTDVESVTCRYGLAIVRKEG
jgi:hypothetical protein